MTNLMKSIRDNEFHVPCTGYSDSVYKVATGLKHVRSNAEIYPEVVPLVIPPTSKDYQCLLEKIKCKCTSILSLYTIMLNNNYNNENAIRIRKEPLASHANTWMSTIFSCKVRAIQLPVLLLKIDSCLKIERMSILNSRRKIVYDISTPLIASQSEERSCINGTIVSVGNAV